MVANSLLRFLNSLSHSNLFFEVSGDAVGNMRRYKLVAFTHKNCTKLNFFNFKHSYSGEPRCHTYTARCVGTLR